MAFGYIFPLKFISLTICQLRKIYDIFTYFGYFAGNLTQFGTARQSSSFSNGLGKPEYAIYPPITNNFSLSTCSHAYLTDSTESAWWMFQFSVGPMYITDITIYFRKDCKYTHEL